MINGIYAASLSILNELRASILSFKLENNIELLSDFNKKIHQIISRSFFGFWRKGDAP